MNQTLANTTVDSTAFEPLLDEKEVARILSVGDGTPGNWRRAKPQSGPPYIFVEGAVRYRPADIRGYLEARRRDPSTSEAS